MSEGTRIVSGLDDSPRFLLIPFDVFIVWITVLFAGALVGKLTAGCVLGTVTAWGWHRLSARRGRHFALALTYWYAGISTMKRTPESAARRFTG